MFTNERDTIISLITSSSGGSVSLIRMSGPESIPYIKKYFSGNIQVRGKGGRFYFGKIFDDNKRIIDEVILLVYKGPYSYTGEDVVEISCHANPFIIEDIIRLFLDTGCRMAAPGEFTKRAFLNGKMDLVQAEAVADLIMSKSKAGVKHSLMSMEGKLSATIKQIKTSLIEIAVLMELDLDFTEEDLENIDRKNIIEKLESVIKQIDMLVESYRYGHVLSKGIEVLIAGRPNVGKSSLMNAFLKKNRVIVSDIPGTTRDMIHEDIVMDNTLVRLIDSAGIRSTDDLIEAEGASRARNFMEHADIIILLVDISKPFLDEDIQLLENVSQLFSQKTLFCANKSDLGMHPESHNYLHTIPVEVNYISATEGQGIDQIKKTIIKKVHTIEKDVPEDIVISNERQFTTLKHCREALMQSVDAVKNQTGYEFVSVDLKEAIHYLAGITGEITTDDVLNRIFGQFCIGK